MVPVILHDSIRMWLGRETVDLTTGQSRNPGDCEQEQAGSDLSLPSPSPSSPNPDFGSNLRSTHAQLPASQGSGPLSAIYPVSSSDFSILPLLESDPFTSQNYSYSKVSHEPHGPTIAFDYNRPQYLAASFCLALQPHQSSSLP